MQTRLNMNQIVECGHSCSKPRDNAKLMINFFFAYCDIILKEILLIILGPIWKNIQATADFHQRNLDGVQAKMLKGEHLDNGNFIFSWENDVNRKMVLTRNNGEHLETGYMKQRNVDDSNWKDPSNWIGRSKSEFYSISNFRGSPGIHLCL